MHLSTILLGLMTVTPALISAAPLPAPDLTSLSSAGYDFVPLPDDLEELAKRAVTKKPTVKKPTTAAKKPAAAAKKPATPAKPAAKAPATKAPAKAKAPATKAAKTTAKAAKTASAKTPAKTADGAACAFVPGQKKGAKAARGCNNCAALQTCGTCTAQAGCGFSTITFKCAEVDPKRIGANVITSANSRDRCPAVLQQVDVFPAIPGKKKNRPVAVPGAPGGLPTSDIVTAFNAIKPHVFTRESAARPDSGQHLKSVWIKNHTGAKATPTCNNTTGLCTFADGSATGKTVWNDDAGFYNQQDVINMCSVALALNDIQGGTRHVVMTPLNAKICIQATKQTANFNAQTGAGQGSCFPVGTAASTGKLNDAC
jgi:hypothetical protein